MSLALDSDAHGDAVISTPRAGASTAAASGPERSQWTATDGAAADGAATNGAATAGDAHDGPATTGNATDAEGGGWTSNVAATAWTPNGAAATAG